MAGAIAAHLALWIVIARLTSKPSHPLTHLFSQRRRFCDAEVRDLGRARGLRSSPDLCYPAGDELTTAGGIAAQQRCRVRRRRPGGAPGSSRHVRDAGEIIHPPDASVTSLADDDAGGARPGSAPRARRLRGWPGQRAGRRRACGQRTKREVRGGRREGRSWRRAVLRDGPDRRASHAGPGRGEDRGARSRRASCPQDRRCSWAHRDERGSAGGVLRRKRSPEAVRGAGHARL